MKIYSSKHQAIVEAPILEKPELLQYWPTQENTIVWRKENEAYNKWLSTHIAVPEEFKDYWADGLEVKEGIDYEVRVKSVKSSSSEYWYKDRLGELFEFEEYDNGYKVSHGLDMGTGYGYIQYEDAEQVAIPIIKQVSEERQCAHEWVGYSSCCYCGAYQNMKGDILEKRVQYPVEDLRQKFSEWYFGIKEQSGQPPLAMQIFHFFETRLSIHDKLFQKKWLSGEYDEPQVSEEEPSPQQEGEIEKQFKERLSQLLKMYMPDGEPILIHKAWLSIQPLQSQLSQALEELGLLKIQNGHTETLLKSCEQALSDREQKIKDQEAEIEALNKEVPTHYHVADNSDAFREWLKTKGVDFIPNGHYTSLPLKEQDIFWLGMEFGVYKYQHQTQKTHKPPQP